MTKDQLSFERFIMKNYFTYYGDYSALLNKNSQGEYTNRDVREYYHIWQSAISGIYEKDLTASPNAVY